METTENEDVAVIAHRLLDSVAVIAAAAYTVRTADGRLDDDERQDCLARIEAHALAIGAVLGGLVRGHRDAALAALLTAPPA